MRESKRVFFEELTDQHARLILRLRYDKISQGMFFRSLIKYYVDGEINMLKLIEKIKIEKRTMGKEKIKKSTEAVLSGTRMLEDLGFSSADKKDIYDLIEGDFEEQNE